MMNQRFRIISLVVASTFLGGQVASAATDDLNKNLKYEEYAPSTESAEEGDDSPISIVVDSPNEDSSDPDSLSALLQNSKLERGKGGLIYRLSKTHALKPVIQVFNPVRIKLQMKPLKSTCVPLPANFKCEIDLNIHPMIPVARWIQHPAKDVRGQLEPRLRGNFAVNFWSKFEEMRYGALGPQVRTDFKMRCSNYAWLNNGVPPKPGQRLDIENWLGEEPDATNVHTQAPEARFTGQSGEVSFKLSQDGTLEIDGAAKSRKENFPEVGAAKQVIQYRRSNGQLCEVGFEAPNRDTEIAKVSEIFEKLSGPSEDEVNMMIADGEPVKPVPKVKPTAELSIDRETHPILLQAIENISNIFDNEAALVLTQPGHEAYLHMSLLRFVQPYGVDYETKTMRLQLSGDGN